jgi:hypothetical protein
MRPAGALGRMESCRTRTMGSGAPRCRWRYAEHACGSSTHPDQPPATPPEKPKQSAAERRLRYEDRLKTIRLRMAIGRELDDRGITTPAAIGEAPPGTERRPQVFPIMCQTEHPATSAKPEDG